jgi:Amino acid synthesis
MAPSIEDRYHVRRWHSIVQEIREVEGRLLKAPLLKAVVGVVIKNPFAGKGFVDDLSSLTEHSALIGHDLGKRVSALLDGRPIEGYGKGGIAGLDGSQEHVVACVTTIFGDAFRDEVGGGKAWISSATKVGVPGVSLDIPLAYKDEVYVRSHYDAISFTVPDGPLPDEMVICVAVSSGERPHHRVGGMTIADVSARDSA